MRLHNSSSNIILSVKLRSRFFGVPGRSAETSSFIKRKRRTSFSGSTLLLDPLLTFPRLRRISQASRTWWLWHFILLNEVKSINICERRTIIIIDAWRKETWTIVMFYSPDGTSRHQSMFNVSAETHRLEYSLTEWYAHHCMGNKLEHDSHEG